MGLCTVYLSLNNFDTDSTDVSALKPLFATFVLYCRYSPNNTVLGLLSIAQWTPDVRTHQSLHDLAKHTTPQTIRANWQTSESTWASPYADLE
jgi:hypothetical protein